MKDLFNNVSNEIESKSLLLLDNVSTHIYCTKYFFNELSTMIHKRGRRLVLTFFILTMFPTFVKIIRANVFCMINVLLAQIISTNLNYDYYKILIDFTCTENLCFVIRK